MFKQKVMALAIIGLFCAVSATMVIASISTAETDEKRPNPTGYYGGTLNVAFQNDVLSLNVLKANDVWSSYVLSPIYDSLLGYDMATQETLPWIATDWYGGYPGHPDPKDVLNYTLTMRTDVKWHDGEMLKIRDVYFSFKVAAEIPLTMSSLECLKWGNYSSTHYLGIHIINDTTLFFRLSKPYANFLTYTISQTLIPMHIWETYLKSKGYNGMDDDYISSEEATELANWANLEWPIGSNNIYGALIGCGPFKFMRRDPGSSVKLVAFDDYFSTAKLTKHWKGWPPRADLDLDASAKNYKPNPPSGYSKGRAYIDSILFKIYTDSKLAVQALLNREVDYLAWSVDPSALADIGGDPGITMVSALDMGYFYMNYNFRLAPFGGETQKEIDYYRDFRRAVAHLIDKKTFVDRLLQGYGYPGDSTISPANVKYYNSALEKYTFDPAKAKSILDSRGWVDTDGDGWRNLPGKGNAQIKILTPDQSYDPVRAAAGQIIAKQMVEAGINAFSQPMTFGEIVNRMGAHDYDIYILGWAIGGTEAGETLKAFFGTGQAQNYGGFTNKTLDDLFTNISKEFDPDKKVLQCKLAQQIVNENIVYHVLYYKINMQAYRNDRYTGWVLNPSSSAGIYNWDSLLHVRAPQKPMSVQVIHPNKVPAGKTWTISIEVKDKSTNAPIRDATVEVKVWGTESTPGWAGTIAPLGQSGTTNTAEGKTDGAGMVKFTYTAPTLTGNETNRSIMLDSKVTFAGYDDVLKTRWFKVSAGRMLVVELQSTAVSLRTGETATITVTVKTENYEPIAGANVSAEFTPKDIQCKLSPATAITDSAGKAIFTFKGTPSKETTYTLKFTASYTGYEPSPADIQVTITPGGGGMPGFELPGIILGLLLAVIVFLIVRRRG